MGNLEVVLLPEVQALDPDENADWLIENSHINEDFEPISEEFIGYMKNCVETPDQYSMIENGDPTNPAEDCTQTQKLTQRFAALLMYGESMGVLDAINNPNTVSAGLINASNYIPSGDFTWPIRESKTEATNNLAGCLRESTQEICKAGHPYRAHDLFAPQGTVVVSATKGAVRRARVSNCGHGFGRAFSVQIVNNTGGQEVTYFYQHLSPGDQRVKEGDAVLPGTPIGTIGPSSAACNTPPHLHIDASLGNRRVPCSRLKCTESNKSKFVDIGGSLYDAYTRLR